MKKLFVLLAFMVIASTSYAQIYKMYKTQNYHNQLRLNTMTGKFNKFKMMVSLGKFVVQEKF